MERVAACAVVSQAGRGRAAHGDTSTPDIERKHRMLKKLFAPTIEVSAHCDLPCGVYDPAQARIEAESVKAIIAKVADNDDPDFRTRAILIKEQRSELVKHHLWVLWTDYFKPPHFEKYPQLPPAGQRGHQAGRRDRHQGRARRGQGRRAARQDRRDRRDLLGDQEVLSSAQDFSSEEALSLRSADVGRSSARTEQRRLQSATGSVCDSADVSAQDRVATSRSSV